MVYTPALIIGHGYPMASSEQESVFDVIGKYLFPFASDERRRRGSVESCDEVEKSGAIADLDGGLQDGETLLQHNMVGQITQCLSEAKRLALGCQVLLLPRQMASRVARDVARSSVEEPCGLRGAFIVVYLEEESKDGPVMKHLGVIRPDATVTPTFELSVVFKTQVDRWSPLKHIFVSQDVCKLRPEYRLVKRKLYSPENPVIHDFY